MSNFLRSILHFEKAVINYETLFGILDSHIFLLVLYSVSFSVLV